jgi:transcriptional regulator with XRE-family HTH domain
MAPSRRDYEAERREREAGAIAFGKRLRKARLTYQLGREYVAQAAGIPLRSLIRYELGSQTPPPARISALASAIGCPAASFLVDDVVLAELRVSPETLERVRSEGQPAADEVAARIAATLAPLLLAEATRPPVDLRPGARPRKRRDRAQVLAGVARAKERSAARAARDAAAGEIR